MNIREDLISSQHLSVPPLHPFISSMRRIFCTFLIVALLAALSTSAFRTKRPSYDYNPHCRSKGYDYSAGGRITNCRCWAGRQYSRDHNRCVTVHCPPGYEYVRYRTCRKIRKCKPGYILIGDDCLQGYHFQFGEEKKATFLAEDTDLVKKFTKHHKQDVWGHDIKHLKAATLQVCLTECGADPKCKAVGYQRGATIGWCYLKRQTKLDRKHHMDYADLYIKK